MLVAARVQRVRDILALRNFTSFCRRRLTYPWLSSMASEDTQDPPLPAPNEADLASHHDNLRESREELWYLKEVSFRSSPDTESRSLKVITQNYNGSVQ